MTCPIRHPTCHRETEAACPTRRASGETVCNLGRPTVQYELRLREDGAVTATLSILHRTWLCYMANCGGEVTMDWDQAERQRRKPANQTTSKTVRDNLLPLVEMRLMTETPIVGASRSVLRLTDAGRNVVSQINAERPAP